MKASIHLRCCCTFPYLIYSSFIISLIIMSAAKTTVTTYLLTGDIGGTNSRMSLYDATSEKPLVVKTFRNAEHLPVKVRSNPAAFQTHIVIPFLEHCWNTTANKLVALEQCQIIGCLATAGLAVGHYGNTIGYRIGGLKISCAYRGPNFALLLKHGHVLVVGHIHDSTAGKRCCYGKQGNNGYNRARPFKW